jgi:hypothetical protein
MELTIEELDRILVWHHYYVKQQKDDELDEELTDRLGAEHQDSTLPEEG